eukprot:GSMAST32.ASY1.ANO1.1543.1 assembled CDS
MKQRCESGNVAETIKVVARVRPLIEREAITVSGSQFVRVAQRGKFNSNPKQIRCHQFDRVFSDTSSQAEVYASTRPFIKAALEGYNSTIFAYGQTGTGKTHTILGNMWGLIPRAMKEVFRVLNSKRRDISYTVKCTYLEIYNERIYDLLYVFSTFKCLDIREEIKGGGVFVPQATNVQVDNEEEVLQILWKGARDRAMFVETLTLIMNFNFFFLVRNSVPNKYQIIFF